jgi:hypothetical protein
VWDRYLPYGAALGTTRTASAVIDLGLGDQRRPWSSYGGVWHRVRVRYPRWRPWYGRTAPALAFRALLALGAGWLLVRWWRPFVGDVSPILPEALGTAADLVAPAGFGAGLVLIGYGFSSAARLIHDRLSPVTVTGQVLWIALWQSTSGGEDSPPTPLVYHLAVDDGTGERTTAWAMPASLHGSCDTGDTVRLTARRWSRRVDTITVVERGTPGHRDGAEPKVDTSRAATATNSRAADLLTSAEVTQALGLAATAIPMPIGMLAQFAGPDGKPVLMIQVLGGTLSRVATRVAGLAQRPARATPLPGVGDEAWLDEDRAVARLPGGTLVALVLLGDARGRGAALPGLLTTLVSRVLTDRAGAADGGGSPIEVRQSSP